MTYVSRHGPARRKTYSAGIATAKTIRETMPTACEGKNLWNGNRNPVTLVSTVVTKKTAVQPLLRFALRNPARTTNPDRIPTRSEEHTSELQSQSNLVCRLLLEKKKKNSTSSPPHT